MDASRSGLVSPTVGSPSVINRISGKRPLVDCRTHRFAQRAFDVRSALRFERVEVAIGFAKVRRRRGNEVVAEGAHVAREVDQPKAIFGSQRADQLASGGACLLHLSALHRTRHVEHERHVAWRGFSASGWRRRHRDEREAIFVSRRVWQHADRRGGVATNGNEERDVARIAANTDVRLPSRSEKSSVWVGEKGVPSSGDRRVAQRERRRTDVARRRLIRLAAPRK